jgi:SRSO17 transposase
MKKRSEEHDLESYLDWLKVALGHADREAGLKGYCRGLMLPLERKSVEPIAAQLDPRHVRARHQALHHFVAQSEWSDAALLKRVRDWVLPQLVRKEPVYWIIDDTGMRKKGRHSVGVARQYCGQIGKQDNCQVAVSLSIATAQASLPVAWQLYLPTEWAADVARRRDAGVPQDIAFSTKPDIALAQVRQAHAAGVPVGTVLADAAYGTQTQWREALSELELEYAVGVVSSMGVWAPGTEPLPPPKRKRGMGRPKVRRRLVAGQGPVSIKALALLCDRRRLRTVRWRQGTNTPLSSRFAALRVRAAQGDPRRAQLRAEEWLLIEWPRGESEPTKYWLSNLPSGATLKQLVTTAKARWRIERDYEELKQEFGLTQYEGRGWRGFHHHASLCIAAYGFLVGQRLRGARQKKPSELPQPALPRHYRPRGAAASAASRGRLDRHSALAPGSRARPALGVS